MKDQGPSRPVAPPRKPWLTVAMAAVAILALCGALLSLTHKAHVTRAGFDAIRPGMTLAEVEALLGGAPGDYRTGPMDLNVEGGNGEFFNVMSAPEVLLGERKFQHEWWQGDEGNAWVCFDEDGRVVTKEFTPGRRWPPFPLDRIYALLGW